MFSAIGFQFTPQFSLISYRKAFQDLQDKRQKSTLHQDILSAKDVHERGFNYASPAYTRNRTIRKTGQRTKEVETPIKRVELQKGQNLR